MKELAQFVLAQLEAKDPEIGRVLKRRPMRTQNGISALRPSRGLNIQIDMKRLDTL